MIIKRTLLAARHATSKDLQRPALCGVRLERHEGRVAAVATDGHVLVRIEQPAEDDAEYPVVPGFSPPDAEPETVEGFTIPSETVEGIRKAMPKSGFPGTRDRARIDAHAALSDGTLRAATGNPGELTTVQARVVDEEFPDYRKVMPGGEAKASVVLDLRLVERICKAFREACPDARMLRVTVEVRDDLNPVRFVREDPSGTVEALVMPVRK